MAVTFSKAPLIELIAELRWIPTGSSMVEPAIPQQSNLPAVFFGGNKQEEFYMRVGGALFKSGFNRSERLAPVGIPFTLHQPLYRFRSEMEDRRSVLYQVGYGIFSVHALPPYHSWDRFWPFVKNAIDVLFESRPEADSGKPFTQLTLRYIDFFSEEIMEGRDFRSFMSQVLGISTTLPAALVRIATSNEVRSLFTKVVLPIEIGDLTVSVGDGKFNNQSGILLDTAASATETSPDSAAIIKMFDSAYHVIHNLFFEITKPIHRLMQPTGVNDK
jgi:uncharacterized protein (TIGR04255 family)